MQRGAFTTALNCSGRQHGIEKGRTKKGTSASRLRGQTAFLIMSACRLSGGAPYYPRDFGPSPERSLAAFVSVGPPGCSHEHAVSLCRCARLLAMLIIGYPWYVLQYLHAMPPRHAAMRTPQRTCPPRTLRARRKRTFGGRVLSRAFSDTLSRAPRGRTPNHPARDRAQPAGAGASAWRGVQGVCGLTAIGMRALGARGAAVMFYSLP